MANAKAAAKAAEETKASATTPAVVEKLQHSYQNVTENFKGYRENLSQAGTVATDTVRSTYTGVMAFDRAVLNVLRANLDTWVEHGRNIAKAPNLIAVAEQHADFVNTQIGAVGGQLKDLTNVAEEQTKASMAPLFSAVDELVASSKSKKDDKAA
jgi:hypothetical protein